MIEFFIPSTPVPQGRPRFVKRGKTSVAYDPAKSRDYKSWVRTCGLKAMAEVQATPYQRDIPLCMRLEIYIHRPRGHYGSGRNKEQLKDSAPRMPTTKPDCSNVQKGIEDALESICYEADQQITHVTVQKRYGAPGVLVMLWEDKL